MSNVVAFPRLINGKIPSRHHTIHVKKIEFLLKNACEKSLQIFIKANFYRNMVSGFQEEAWKNTQLQKQKFLGEGSLIKSPVVIPQQYVLQWQYCLCANLLRRF